MGWHLTALADVAATPWRNGGGITRELAVWPPQGDWHWRISVAEVAASGPFSRFEDVERWFAVLSGAGVRLDIAGNAHTLNDNSAPLQFDGGADTQCTLLGGPTQDFNLMVRGAGVRAAARSAPCPPPALRAPPLPAQNALPPSLLDGARATDARMLRVTALAHIVIDAPKIIAVYAINTWAIALFDSEAIHIPPQTLAWRRFEQTGTVSLQAENALWMEIPL